MHEQGIALIRLSALLRLSFMQSPDGLGLFTVVNPISAQPSSQPLLVLPTYNEALSLPAVLVRLFALPIELHILVVDDGSPDGTAGLVRAHAEFGLRLFMIERAGKQGLGSAYRAGFQWAIERGYTAALEMDADLSHDPDDVPRLLAALDQGADLAIGSRYMKGISVVHWPLSRLLLSIGAGYYVRALAGLPLTDPTSGFKAIRREALLSLKAANVVADGYGFQIELHFKAYRLGLVLREVPIVFTERRDGQSKLSAAITLEAIWLVPKLGLRRLFGRRIMPASNRPVSPVLPPVELSRNS
jgi:dolichol-phosphate mannosyltransferase